MRQARHGGGIAARVLERTAAALAAGAMLASAAFASPVLVPYGKSGSWTVYGIQEGSTFLACKATHGRSGPGIGIDGGGWIVTTPGSPKGTVKGTLTIDGKAFKGEFRAGGRDYVWRMNDTMRRTLRGGTTVEISPAGARTGVLDLKGSGAAMDMLKTCLSNRGIAPGKGGSGGIAGIIAGGGAGAATTQPSESAMAQNGWNCPAPGKLASSKDKPEANKATAKFINKTWGTIGIYWINYRGIPEARARIPPGQEYTVDTFQGQIWLAKDGNGNCLGGGALRPRKAEHNRYVLK